MDIEDYLQQKEERLQKSGKRIKDYRVFDFNYMPEKPLMRDEVKPIADAILLGLGYSFYCCWTVT